MIYSARRDCDSHSAVVLNEEGSSGREIRWLIRVGKRISGVDRVIKER